MNFLIFGWTILNLEIRLFRPEDAEQIAQLFHDTVRSVNVRDYSIDQVKAWAPDNLDFRNWIEACSSRFTFVADQAGLIVGFGELEPNGHIDYFYVHQDYQGCGVGRRIYGAIEHHAQVMGIDWLFVEASITAKPFFERIGFSTLSEQQVVCRGESFTNYKMAKCLGDR